MRERTGNTTQGKGIPCRKPWLGGRRRSGAHGQVSPPGSAGSEKKNTEKAALAQVQLGLSPLGLVQVLLRNPPQTPQIIRWRRWGPLVHLTLPPIRVPEASPLSWPKRCSAPWLAWHGLMDVCMGGESLGQGP